jgi:hypothetical protein
MIGRDKAESTGCSTQSAVEVKGRLNLAVTRDESHVSVGGLLALGYVLRKKERLRKNKDESTKCAEGT